MKTTVSLKGARLGIFAALFLSSVIMLPISAVLTLGTFEGAGSFWIGIMSSVFTLVFPVIVFGLEASGKATWMSWTAIELTWTLAAAILSPFTGGLSIGMLQLVCGGDCLVGVPYTCAFPMATLSICQEIRALAVFGFINFLLAMVLFVWTLTVAIRATKKGKRSIWISPAHKYDGRAAYITAPSPASSYAGRDIALNPPSPASHTTTMPAGGSTADEEQVEGSTTAFESSTSIAKGKMADLERGASEVSPPPPSYAGSPFE